jgi:hypothetical protein
VLVESVELLQTAGFDRTLTMDNRELAATALTEYFGYYRYLGALQQFTEGTLYVLSIQKQNN